MHFGLLGIVFFYLGCVIYLQHSKGSFIKYFKPSFMSFALNIWMILSSSHGLLQHRNHTYAGFCSNCEPLASTPKQEKYIFGLPQLEYKGCVFFKYGLKAGPTKCRVILEWSQPTKRGELWFLLSMAN